MIAADIDFPHAGLPVMLLPLNTDNMVMPNVMVVEIKHGLQVDVEAESPEWFIGYVTWRGQRLPLISFESLNGAMAISADQVSSVAVVKSIAGRGHLPYYAVVISDRPQILDLDSLPITIHEGRPRGRAEALSVALGEQTGGIPNIDWVEQHLLTYILHS